MLRGLWKLTWVETKVFLREPMGVFSSLGLPVLFFVLIGQAFGGGAAATAATAPFNVAIMAALFISITAVLSLVAIISIYREGGILKRLRATPLSPVTILTAHVIAKLVFTVTGLVILVAAGRQFLPGAIDVDLPLFTAALLVGTLGILSMGFVIASIVPTARFAQPLAAALLYPMIAVSGLFFPLSELSPGLHAVATALPTTHAVTLMQGVWDGTGWDVGATVGLAVAFVVFVGISSRVFRWE